MRFERISDARRLLQGVPLFADLPASELADLVGLMRPIELERGAVLWRQGDEADGLHVIGAGSVRVMRRQPGGGELELARLGPGDVLGEVPLVDGGRRSATARVDEATLLLFLARIDFAALTARRHPTAFAVKRRICALVCERLRTRYAVLAESLPAGQIRAPGAATPLTDPPHRPNPEYLHRLAFFDGFGAADLTEVLARTQLGFAPPATVLAREGDRPNACFVTLNGAVEEMIERGDRKIAVGLSGPGRAFGYLGLIDGQPTPLTAITRERALLLVIPDHVFARYFGGATSASYALFDGVERDLMTALRRSDLGFVRAVSRNGARVRNRSA